MSGVSVVIVSYHTGPALWPVLHSVLKQEQLHELVLVDNGNPPEITARLNRMARAHPKMKILSGHGNVGFARGCNIGASMANGDHLLLLNPDSLLPEKALARMVEAFAQHKDTTLGGAQLIDLYGRPWRHNRRVLLSPRNAIFESALIRKLFFLSDPPLPKEIHETASVSGAFMFLRREDYKKLGGMDEGYFLHVEDADFSMRVHKAGGKIICVPDVKVMHFGSTSDAPSFFIEWHKARGFFRYFTTHFKDPLSLAWLVFLLPALFMRGLVKAVCQYARYLLFPQKNRSLRCWLLLRHYMDELPANTALEGKTALVIGATGEAGPCITGRLLAAGAKVIAVTRKGAVPFPHPNLVWLTCDLEEGLPLEGRHIDIAVHAAPLWLLSQHLKALAASGVRRLVALGSVDMLSMAGSISAYELGSVLKLEEVEHMIERSGTACTILRPTMVYGTGQGPLNRMSAWIKRFRVLPCYPPASGRRQPVHADDVAQAVLQVLAAPHTAGRAYNIGGGETLPYKDMVRKIYYTLEQPSRLVMLPFLPVFLDILGKISFFRQWSGETARRMNRDITFDYSDARRDFGYTPRGFLTAGIMDLY